MGAQKIGWRIEGEFITDLVRGWFWEEGKPYDKCEAVLLSCLGGTELSESELKSIAQDIIEGRKKLVGVNELTLEDDSENVRPISKKLQEVDKQNRIEEIRNMMIANMIDFVDPFSAVKSRVSADKCGYVTLEECRTWFWYDDYYIDHVYKRPKFPDDTDTMLLSEDDDTEAGLWLYNYPDVVYDAMSLNNAKPSNEDFWDDLYTVIKDDSRFQSKNFARRNEKYLAAKRVEEGKRQRENGMGASILEEPKKRTLSEKEEVLLKGAEETVAFADKWLSENEEPEKGCSDGARVQKYYAMKRVRAALNTVVRDFGIQESDRMYMILPDNYEAWEGLIAPNGDFYSCDFGGHNMKAYYIICAFPEKFPNIDYNDFHVDSAEALDDLLEQGWCATRYLPTCGSYIELPRNLRGECTKAQKDAIFDVKMAHNVSVDLTPIGY